MCSKLRHARLICLAAGTISLGWAATANAAGTTENWIGGTSNWNTPANWNPVGLPGNQDYANILDADNVNRTINYNYNGAAVTLVGVLVNNTGGGLQALSMGNTGEALTANYEDIGGYLFSSINGAGVGNVAQTASTNNVTTVDLGFNAKDNGAYTLGGTGQLSVGAGGAENVGVNGTGTFTQTTGSNNTISGVSDLLSVAENASSLGAYTLNGGNLSVSGTQANEYIGDQGVGTFTQTGGNNGSDSLYVGHYIGSTGTYNLSNSGSMLNISTNEYIGYGDSGASSGTFNQSGGTNYLTNAGDNANLYLGYNTGATGTYALSGTGSLICGNQFGISNEYVGFNGTGSFDQTGGTNTSNGSLTLYVGEEPGSTGTYTLSGTGVLTAIGETIGDGGSGAFNQTGGTNNVTAGSSVLVIGNATGSTGTYTLSGTGLLVGTTCEEIVGNLGTGNFNQSGGANVLEFGLAASRLYIGASTGGTGTYTLSGNGKLQISGDEDVGLAGTGNFNQSGGTNTLLTSSPLYVGTNSGSTGTYTLSGTGSISAADKEYVGYDGLGTFNQTGGLNQIASMEEMDLAYNTDGTGTYNLSGTGSLIAPNVYVGGSAGGSGGKGVLTVGGGILNVTTAIAVYNTSGSSLGISGGAITSPTLNLIGGNFNQSGGTATFAQIVGTGNVALTGGQTTLSVGGSPSQVNKLSISGNAVLDMTKDSLAINFGSPANDPTTAIRLALTSGYHNGAWNGVGINSSSAAVSNGKNALGYADGNTDAGTTALSNQMLIRYTLVGDTTLDETVNLTDLLALLNSYGQTGGDWSRGDFNYDGAVNLTDLLALLNNYGQTASLSSAGSDIQSVPEPASAGLLAISLAGLMRRRHGRIGRLGNPRPSF